MTVTITPQTVISGFALLGAITGILLYVAKAVRWFDRQGAQDKALHTLKARHDEDMKAVQKELSIITRGQLACLKGLREQGCNGPVSEALGKLEKHLNKQAHKWEEL